MCLLYFVICVLDVLDVYGVMDDIVLVMLVEVYWGVVEINVIVYLLFDIFLVVLLDVGMVF